MMSGSTEQGLSISLFGGIRSQGNRNDHLLFTNGIRALASAAFMVVVAFAACDVSIGVVVLGAFAFAAFEVKIAGVAGVVVVLTIANGMKL